MGLEELIKTCTKISVEWQRQMPNWDIVSHNSMAAGLWQAPKR